jgi:predicted nucleic acid-binding protein
LSAYADAGFLVSLYTRDAHSPRVTAILQAATEPLPFTPLHRLEIRNAIRLRVFRREITAIERAAALAEIEADLDNGVLVHVPLPWTDTLREAERLSAAHTEIIGGRSLDIVHVAAALLLGAKGFLSFDDRQRRIAKAEGLKVKP